MKDKKARPAEEMTLSEWVEATERLFGPGSVTIHAAVIDPKTGKVMYRGGLEVEVEFKD